jgi:hypothetical protein
MRQGPSVARAHDLVRTISFLWIWGVPAAVMVAAESAWTAHRLSATATGLLFTISTMWIGIGCYLNGRRCGRTHCLIDGYLLPPLALIGLLNLVSITAIRWQTYFKIFLLIVTASFVLECCGGKYLGRGMHAPMDETMPDQARNKRG